MSMHRRRLYLSFLGAGNYEPARYLLPDGRCSTRPSPYVQVAELQVLGPFDRVVVLATQTSWAKHGQALVDELQDVLGHAPEHVLLDEELDVDAQWGSFEKVLGVVQDRDRVVFDFTHGFRSVPIILSAALEFLRRARDIEVEAVLYGAWEKDKNLSPVIDMRDFYAIGAWTDAVARLVEDADARALTALAEKDDASRFRALASPELREALDALTDGIRSVDVPRVESQARAALAAVENARTDTDLPSDVLLGLVADKFRQLVVEAPLDGNFDHDFFRCQTALERLLVDHRLFMQAFTVLREHIASLGMRAVPKAGLRSGEKKRYRQRYGEVFWQMVLREAFEVRDDTRALHAKLAPWFEALEGASLIAQLRTVAKGVEDIRNGLNHAWMSSREPDPDMEAKARAWIDQLEEVTAAAFALDVPTPSSSAPELGGLVNVSNHPSMTWSPEQLEAARAQFGEVLDLPEGFPAVRSEARESDVRDLAKRVVKQIDALDPDGFGAVFIAGEMRLTVALVAALQRAGRRCVTTAADRDTSERALEDGTSERVSRFRFLRWADYPHVGR